MYLAETTCVVSGHSKSAAPYQAGNAGLPELLPDDPEMAAILEEALTEAFAAGQARLPDGQAEKPEAAPEETPEAENTAANSEHCPDCGRWLTGGGICSDCQGSDEAVKQGKNPDSAKIQAAEIGKRKAALAKCLEEKTDVYDALARSDLGTISFIYDFHDRGIAHFLHRKETLKELPKTLIYGTLGGAYQGGEKRNITYGRYTAVLRLDRDGNRETWVMTSFGPKDFKGDREIKKKEVLGERRTCLRILRLLPHTYRSRVMRSF